MIFESLFPIAAFLVGATAITSTSCYDKGDLAECCLIVEPANSTLIAEKDIQAGDLASDKSVGFNCTDPEGDVVEGTLQCENPNSSELCCGHELFIANDAGRWRACCIARIVLSVGLNFKASSKDTLLLFTIARGGTVSRLLLQTIARK
ncbi:hypothetical protein IW262DRAFT_1301479 [Armillaria fumosa]|nr:hypothetical protein IW262DRAFT_1301479 [Armillaria fumosa]